MLETLHETTTLNNGVEMPMLGMGTYKADQGGEVEQAVRWALELGYRSIDTASAYENEAGVGQAIRDSDVSREDIFVTSKVWNDDQGYDETLRAFDDSLQRLRLDYLDLYLVHWPVRGEVHDTWRALETIYNEGRVKSIGVSNFLQQHITRLLDDAEIVPMVNQIEFHPHLQQPQLLDFCIQHEIQMEAWSPLMKGEVFDLSELQRIGEKYSKSPGQVTLRWQMQRGIVTIPKSVQREHLESNSRVFDFELTDDDIDAINALDQDRRTGPEPATFAD